MKNHYSPRTNHEDSPMGYDRGICTEKGVWVGCGGTQLTPLTCYIAAPGLSGVNLHLRGEQYSPQ